MHFYQEQTHHRFAENEPAHEQNKPINLARPHQMTTGPICMGLNLLNGNRVSANYHISSLIYSKGAPAGRRVQNTKFGDDLPSFIQLTCFFFFFSFSLYHSVVSALPLPSTVPYELIDELRSAAKPKPLWSGGPVEQRSHQWNGFGWLSARFAIKCRWKEIFPMLHLYLIYTWVGHGHGHCSRRVERLRTARLSLLCNIISCVSAG